MPTSDKSVRVQLPPLLRGTIGGERWVEAQGSSIRAVLADLAKTYPALGLHLFDEAGAVRPNIVFLHDGEMIRAREAATRKLKAGDEVIITNALAGG